MCKNDQEVAVSSNPPGNTAVSPPPSFGRGPKKLEATPSSLLKTRGMLEMIRLLTREHTLKS